MAKCIYFENYFQNQPFCCEFKPENCKDWSVKIEWSITSNSVIQKISLEKDEYFESYYYADLEIVSVLQKFDDTKIVKSERMASNNIQFLIHGNEYACFGTYSGTENGEINSQDEMYQYKITLTPIFQFSNEIFRKPGKRTKIDLLEGLKKLSNDIGSVKDKKYSDVILYCGDKKVKAHRNILSARSTLFKKFLQGAEDDEVRRFLEIKQEMNAEGVNDIYDCVDNDIDDFVDIDDCVDNDIDDCADDDIDDCVGDDINDCADNDIEYCGNNDYNNDGGGIVNFEDNEDNYNDERDGDDYDNDRRDDDIEIATPGKDYEIQNIKIENKNSVFILPDKNKTAQNCSKTEFSSNADGLVISANKNFQNSLKRELDVFNNNKYNNEDSSTMFSDLGECAKKYLETKREINNSDYGEGDENCNDDNGNGNDCTETTSTKDRSIKKDFVIKIYDNDGVMFSKNKKVRNCFDAETFLDNDAILVLSVSNEKKDRNYLQIEKGTFYCNEKVESGSNTKQEIGCYGDKSVALSAGKNELIQISSKVKPDTVDKDILAEESRENVNYFERDSNFNYTDNSVALVQKEKCENNLKIEKEAFNYYEGDNQDTSSMSVGINRQFQNSPDTESIIANGKSTAENKPANPNISKVRLKDISPTIFDEFISFIYSGRYKTLNIKKTKELFIAARDFGVCDLENKCIIYLKSQISVETCEDIYNFGSQHDCEKLQIYALDYAKNKIIGRRPRNKHLMRRMIEEQANLQIEDNEDMTELEKMRWLEIIRNHPSYLNDVLKIKKNKKIRNMLLVDITADHTESIVAPFTHLYI